MLNQRENYWATPQMVSLGRTINLNYRSIMDYCAQPHTNPHFGGGYLLGLIFLVCFMFLITAPVVSTPAHAGDSRHYFQEQQEIFQQQQLNSQIQAGQMQQQQNQWDQRSRQDFYNLQQQGNQMRQQQENEQRYYEEQNRYNEMKREQGRLRWPGR